MRDLIHPWLVMPRDPVIVRDGRPFGPDPGARAQSLPFPFPATLAGAVRTRHGEQHGGFDTGAVKPADVRALPVCGPFLVQLASDTNPTARLLLPAPADALLLPKTDQHPPRRGWLRPLAIDAGAQSDLTAHGQPDAPFWPVGMAAPEAVKPLAEPPTFWWWDAYQEWLLAPGDGDIDPGALGLRGLSAESRVHVRIDPTSGAAIEGFLYQTSGREFTHRPTAKPVWGLADTATLALLVMTGADLDEGLGALGGERRTVFWQRGDATLLPTCSAALRDAIQTTQTCRLLLATPGIFAQGLLPQLDWLQIPDLKLAIKGAVASRYDVISGWDYAHGQAKPTRRLAPAGTVYYLSLAGNSEAAIDQFIEQVWLQPISDAKQDRLDGFGVALLGVWDGKQHRMEVK
jgi:CRISPR-associated protein Cmr3